MPAHHLENFLLILRLLSLRLSLVCRGLPSHLPTNKGKFVTATEGVAHAGRVRKHRGGRRCPNGASSKSQKFPVVRESRAKRCRFFVPAAHTGRFWTYGVMMRATAAWQKMQHWVRAERTADRMKFNARITASMDRERFGPTARARPTDDEKPHRNLLSAILRLRGVQHCSQPQSTASGISQNDRR